MVPTLGRTLILLALLVASAGALVGGRPYFDKMSVPIGVALLFVMGVGPALPWGRATRQQLRRALLPPLLGACVLAAVGFALGVRNPWTILALLFGGFTAQVTLSEMFLPVRQRMRARG